MMVLKGAANARIFPGCPAGGLCIGHSHLQGVSEAVARGQLRKLGSRLYTRNLDEDPERLVRRNWYYLITAYYPDALITDRTALENQPASDGSVFLISDKKRDVTLPGLILRPRQGPGPLESDMPFIGGARLASTARAYLRICVPPGPGAGASHALSPALTSKPALMRCCASKAKTH